MTVGHARPIRGWLMLIRSGISTQPTAIAMTASFSRRWSRLGECVEFGGNAVGLGRNLGKPAARTLFVAYDLTKTDPGAVAALRERAPGQVLFERATCWTDPPRVSADVSGLLGQVIVAPWAGQLRRLDGTVGHGPPDDRPVEAVGAEIACAAPVQDEGDGGAPPDPGEGLRRFAEAVTSASACDRDGGWLGGVPDAGPVPSSRFL